MDLARLERLGQQQTWTEAQILAYQERIEDALLNIERTPDGGLLFEFLEDNYLYKNAHGEFEEGQRSVLIGLYQMISSALKRQAEAEARGPRAQTHAVTEESQ